MERKPATLDMATFVRNLERYLEKPFPQGLDRETPFVDLPEWSSLQALLVVAGFELDYGVSISADEFRAVKTVEQLYSVVARKMAE